jgi:dihydrodipicolinate synthase/N-acetylneuraminate lyase
MNAYPAHDLALWELLEARRYEEAQDMWDRVNEPLSAFIEGAARRSGGYRVNKGMMAIMGHPMGVPRPPTLPLDAQEMAELRDLMAGFGWPVPA